MATKVDGLTKGAVNRAGERLREWQDPALYAAADGDLVYETFTTLIAFRTSFQRPLTKVVMGLRSFVKTEIGAPASGSLPVGQRLKREPQIEQKLLRFPGMELSRMQDVGGCRAILPGGFDEVDRVRARIERRWGETIKGGKDYTASPGPTGYRGIHIVVLRDDHLIEIQLRTPGQHEWARAVERTALRLRINLKDGEGPDDLLRYFSMAAEGIDLSEHGKSADAKFMAEFNALREQVRPYFRRKE